MRISDPILVLIVFLNLFSYEQFVSISKEISTLENDLLELKESLVEFKSMPSLLQVDDPTAAGLYQYSKYDRSIFDVAYYACVLLTDRRRITRSSVADLRVVYATQLQTLHNAIEGSAKFVPAIPGRHIISEMGNVLALNPATYKVENTVYFVLLDDSLLVAKRRRKRTGGAGRLVAERCWMLTDIVMQDVKDSTGNQIPPPSFKHCITISFTKKLNCVMERRHMYIESNYKKTRRLYYLLSDKHQKN
jgi:hypothetical protein